MPDPPGTIRTHLTRSIARSNPQPIVQPDLQANRRSSPRRPSRTARQASAGLDDLVAVAHRPQHDVRPVALWQQPGPAHLRPTRPSRCRSSSTDSCHGCTASGRPSSPDVLVEPSHRSSATTRFSGRHPRDQRSEQTWWLRLATTRTPARPPRLLGRSPGIASRPDTRAVPVIEIQVCSQVAGCV
jgi:hypothetical protein